jgi:hypothetical protein
MPFSSQSVEGDSLRTKTSLFIPIDKGKLTCLSAVNLRELSESFDNFVRVGISKGSDTPNEAIAILAQGYCDGMTSVNWSGEILLEPDMQLFIDLWSSDSSTINLTYITEQ